MEQYMDFNSLYGLSADEMKRIDNQSLESLQKERQAAEDQLRAQTGGFLQSAALGVGDARISTLGNIQKQYSGGFEAAAGSKTYSDMLKAQQSLQSQAAAIASSAHGRFGSLRKTYGTDTLAGRVVNSETGLQDIADQGAQFESYMSKGMDAQKQQREAAEKNRRAYVDAANQRLEGLAGKYRKEYETNQIDRDPRNHWVSKQNAYRDAMSQYGLTPSDGFNQEDREKNLYQSQSKLTY